MAVRIYSLAKELKLDSKELVDLCAQIGIGGKGSALASLTDDEEQKVREHLKNPAGRGAAKPGGAAAPLAPERPREPVRAGRMPVLAKPRTATPAAPPKRELDEATPAEELAPAESTAAAPPPSAPAELAAAAPPEVDVPRSPGPLARVMRRDEYVSPGNVSGKPPVLDEIRPGGRVNKPGGSAPARPQRSAIKLAPMPTVEPPKPGASAPGGPAVVKPDLKLPADALKASKGGSKPLAAHLRRHEDALETVRRTKEAAPAADDANKAGRARKGRGGKTAEDAPLLGGREERQMARRRAATTDDDRPVRSPRRISRNKRRTGVSTAAPRKERVSIELPCTVRELSEAAGIPGADILRILMAEGVMATLNSQMDPELTELVAAELGITIDFTAAVSLEDELLTAVRDRVDDPADLLARPPVITFLGHVDHGKTSLLDRIIGTNVVSGESGGITQHIRAYQIEKDGRRISFVDTPGHEAFTEMRARGANVTDIAVLVVPADDGVMPQPEEAISHARAAGVPIVVALNKIDLPGIDENRIYQQLAANELLPSEWGGDVEVVKTSATIGTGLDDLLETLLTVPELPHYRATPQRPGLGPCLEAQQMSDRGVMAKVIVQSGTLRVGDVVVCGEAHGRVKSMHDTLDAKIRYEEVGPSMPVNLWGFDQAPAAGEHFYVLDDIAQAREIAESRAAHSRATALGGVGSDHVTLENLFERLEGANEPATLNIILRADVRGSIEAIQKEFQKLEHPEVRIKVLQSTVGGVTEADVTLADASDAIIIGFNVVPDENARTLAERRGVQIRRYDVIYKITDDLKLALEGMLKPEMREIDLGRALVQQVFRISRVGAVAGCRVLAGTVDRNGRARVIRDSTVIGDYAIETLKREKDDAKEVREGLECGIKLSGFNDVKEGDLFEVYRVEEIGRTFDG
ncbi:MAG TPA: translation initiation factor IF-2 [Lacipirellulaceae bacterium]|nr:translation initiation factor IF-2 [Lacipirellulaceae bacterium]